MNGKLAKAFRRAAKQDAEQKSKDMKPLYKYMKREYKKVTI